MDFGLKLCFVVFASAVGAVCLPLGFVVMWRTESVTEAAPLIWTGFIGALVGMIFGIDLYYRHTF